MTESTSRPQAENGILILPGANGLERPISERWADARFMQLPNGFLRVDLSGTARGACPGFNDNELLAALSKVAPGQIVFGFFCDAINGAEGYRVFQDGAPVDRRRIEWQNANPPDPVAWPISILSVSLQIPIEAITRVGRPERPPIALAVEALLEGGEVEKKEDLHMALQVIGQVPHDEATEVLIRFLEHEDWVARFHAAQGYARWGRGQGSEGHPRLESLLEDEDEGVREAALRGVAELIARVDFTDEELHRQIDAVVKRGLEDEDEDVREAAGEARELRTKLLG